MNVLQFMQIIFVFFFPLKKARRPKTNYTTMLSDFRGYKPEKIEEQKKNILWYPALNEITNKGENLVRKWLI